MVGAVVRHDVDIKERFWIGLPEKTLNKPADDPLLVARGNHAGKTHVRVCPRNRLRFFEREQRHNQKIEACQLQKKHRPGNCVLHCSSPVFLVFLQYTNVRGRRFKPGFKMNLRNV